ncbi:MAG: 30S ribosomal protein S8 [Candidatus Micrarchaeales archaeon]|jgi:small subunit ribosomal protein S8
MPDILAESLNKIKTYENLGREECTVASTALVRSVFATLKKNGYVDEIEEVSEGKFKRLRITLSKKINSIGVVRPRHALKIDDFQKYEKRYIPSRDFGILIISTPKGVMSNREAKENRTGGRLLAYVY